MTTWRRPFGLVLTILLLAACSPSAAETPDAEPPVEEPSVTTPASGYSDAEQAAILDESIGLVYGTEPQANWFSAYRELIVEDGWAYINTTLTTAELPLAEGMCQNIAAITFDDNAEPIGVTDVLIFGLDMEGLTDCDVVS